jgi:hypothetical protein
MMSTAQATKKRLNIFAGTTGYFHDRVQQGCSFQAETDVRHQHALKL